jgi:superfamily II DNA or RNA helicase
MIELGEVERVIVIAPRREVVKQWAADFLNVTGRYMSKVTGSAEDIQELGVDVCATWAAIQGLQIPFQAICKASKTLVICDEHHHAAVSAAWGDNATSAFGQARFVVILSGTPMRSDGASTAWLAYDDQGAIDHPLDGTYTLTYGEAVDLGYCRPVTFHRHEGLFTVDIDGEAVAVSGSRPAEFSAELRRIPALQKALSFYRLACTPLYEPDGTTPLTDGYQWTMVQWAADKLQELRNRMADAGALVIAPTIEMAEYFAKVIELVEGDKPLIVHSNQADSESKIAAFRNTTKKWLVSVAMISEGVDIKRLRVLVYLPSATTELAFRQAIGRVVRSNGPEDDTRAYVVMPSWQIFEEYARRVEDEMPLQLRKEPKHTTKRCPVCSTESPLATAECPACGHTFAERPKPTKACSTCQALNPVSAKQCHSCGAQFQDTHQIKLTLDEALRAGAIVRGMDLSEEAVQESEEIAAEFRIQVLKSGDAKLVKILRLLPEEGYSRLFEIMNSIRK